MLLTVRCESFLLLTAAALIATILWSSSVEAQKAPFRVIREWKYLNFTWDGEEHLQDAISKGLYVPKNNAIAGMSYHNGYYYLALPRMREGVPATLTRIVEEDSTDTAPALQPYPSWKMNSLDDCAALQNVQNVEIDLLGRMWIIDGGRTNTMSKEPSGKCRPKLVLHDVAENRTLLSYTFPESVATNNAFLYDIVVDGNFAYISDNSRSDPGIIVFDLSRVESWKVRHEDTMRAQLNATYFQVDGFKVDTPINLAGIALDPAKGLLYYNPLSSFRLYSISTEALRNRSLTNMSDYVVDLGPRTSQTDGMVMDDQGVLYFGLLGSSSLAKWNTSTPFINNQELISKDLAYIQWPNAFAFNDKGEIVVLTNRLHKYIYDMMDLNENNFRLLASNISRKSYLHAKPQPPSAEITTTTTAATTMTSTAEITTTTTTTTEGNHIHFQMVTTPTATTTTTTTTKTEKPTTTSMKQTVSSETVKSVPAPTSKSERIISSSSSFLLLLLTAVTLLLKW